MGNNFSYLRGKNDIFSSHKNALPLAGYANILMVYGIIMTSIDN